ncbi:MAG: DUF4139 domain-containing protein [Chitinophagaceae bacterium]
MLRIYCTLLFLLSFMLLNAQNTKNANAELQNVTVFNNGVELNHTAKVSNISKGISEVVIGNISNVIDENSLQIGATSNITIMSVKYRNEYTSENNKSVEEKQLESELEREKKESLKINNQINTLISGLTILDENKKVGGTNTGLNVAELQKMMDYYLTKSQDLRNQVQTLNEKKEKQDDIVSKLQNQLNSIKKSNTKSKGEIIIQVLSSIISNTTFTISYISPNASWYPVYDLKTDNTNSPLKIIYKANVSQTTGLDWNNVKITVSTANPSQTGTAPILTPWFLNYRNLNYNYKSIQNANGYANTLQAVEIKTKRNSYESQDKDESVIPYTSINENAISASFDIELPYDIKSDGKKYSISMKEYNLNANYKYYAVPKKDREAFLLAEISAWEELNLLPGEANIIFDGTYVGKSMIDPNSTQDTLNLSMGHDKKIIIRREKLVDFCSTKMIGNKRTHVVTYEIKVKNTRKEAIDLLLKDQYPISQDKDIEVELLESSNASINKETGVLTWEQNIAAGSTKTVRISYSVKFPKDKQVGNLY